MKPRTETDRTLNFIFIGPSCVFQEHARIDQMWSEVSGDKLNTVRLAEDKEDGGSFMFRIPDTNAEKKLRKEMAGDVHVR